MPMPATLAVIAPRAGSLSSRSPRRPDAGVQPRSRGAAPSACARARARPRGAAARAARARVVARARARPSATPGAKARAHRAAARARFARAVPNVEGAASPGRRGAGAPPRARRRAWRLARATIAPSGVPSACSTVRAPAARGRRSRALDGTRSAAAERRRRLRVAGSDGATATRGRCRRRRPPRECGGSHAARSPGATRCARARAAGAIGATARARPRALGRSAVSRARRLGPRPARPRSSPLQGPSSRASRRSVAMISPPSVAGLFQQSLGVSRGARRRGAAFVLRGEIARSVPDLHDRRRRRRTPCGVVAECVPGKIRARKRGPPAGAARAARSAARLAGTRRRPFSAHRPRVRMVPPPPAIKARNSRGAADAESAAFRARDARASAAASRRRRSELGTRRRRGGLENRAETLRT